MYNGIEIEYDIANNDMREGEDPFIYMHTDIDYISKSEYVFLLSI